MLINFFLTGKRLEIFINMFKSKSLILQYFKYQKRKTFKLVKLCVIYIRVKKVPGFPQICLPQTFTVGGSSKMKSQNNLIFPLENIILEKSTLDLKNIITRNKICPKTGN